MIEISAASPAAEDGLYEVTITTEQDLGQVRIEPLPPEEFLISKKAKSLKSAPWWVTGPVGASRSCSTRATPWSRSRRSARRTGPRTARSSSYFADIDGGLERVDYGDPKLEGKSVWLIECYVRANIDGTTSASGKS